jgi:guanylate kinase
LKVLEERLRSRATEDEALIQERLAKAQLEMESATKFDVVIVNDDLEQAKKEMFQNVKAFLAQE